MLFKLCIVSICIVLFKGVSAIVIRQVSTLCYLLFIVLVSIYISIVMLLIIIDTCTIVRLLCTWLLYIELRQEIQLVLTWIFSSLWEITSGVFRVHKHGSIENVVWMVRPLGTARQWEGNEVHIGMSTCHCWDEVWPGRTLHDRKEIPDWHSRRQMQMAEGRSAGKGIILKIRMETTPIGNVWKGRIFLCKLLAMTE